MWHRLQQEAPALVLSVVATTAILGGLRTLADRAYEDNVYPFTAAYVQPTDRIEVTGRRIQHVEVIGRSRPVQRVEVTGRRTV